MPSTPSELLSQLGASKPGFMLLLLCPSLEASQGSVPRASPANMPHTAWGGQAAGMIKNMTLARCGLCHSQVQAQTASVPSGRHALLGALPGQPSLSSPTPHSRHPGEGAPGLRLQKDGEPAWSQPQPLPWKVPPALTNSRLHSSPKAPQAPGMSQARGVGGGPRGHRDGPGTWKHSQGNRGDR